ncbi:hypothetical protein Prudu_002349 [Prunus dulcis]|uniref:Uncharacterized protein n=1 Tax=Prunus dulcis TaxID=3755 RepID=A0A4Y1QQP0_PRUDU|nr:hypothetical protein Prudu_002349 [Prunus dulcis]
MKWSKLGFGQVVSVMSMWTRMQPAYAANMWNEALNKRLGTESLFNLLSVFTRSLLHQQQEQEQQQQHQH